MGYGSDEGFSLKKDLKFPVIFILVLLGGFLLRWVFFASSSFPLHDGGLFYIMVGDLIRNGFQIPVFTSYNNASIPFIYPPLGLFLTGWIESVFKADRLQLFRWIPLLVSTAAIPAFYFLARQVLKEKWTSLAVTAAFSVLPMSYAWVIMGGGVTRAFGELFCILALAFVLRFLDSARWQDGLPAALFCGFTVLSHPEWAWFLFYSLALLCLAAIFQKRGKALILSLAVLLGTLLVVSPWLVSIIKLHGGSISLPLMDSGFNRGGDIAKFIFLSWSNEPFFSVITFFAIAGCIFAGKRKMWVLLIWLPLVFFLQGRAADQKAVVPLALLAGLGIAGLFDLARSRWPAWEGRRFSYAIIAVIWIYALLCSFLFVNQFIKPMPVGFLAGINWIKEKTPSASSYLVISGENWEKDKYSEWISTLTGRESATLVQGYEWLPGFSTRIARYDDANLAYSQGNSKFLEWMNANGIHADFIVLPKWPGYAADYSATKPSLHWNDWSKIPGVVIAFENDDVLIIDLSRIPTS
jgi:hypothetical protein